MTECIEFKGCANGGSGHGGKWFEGRMHYAHRLAYCEAHGLHPDDIKGVVIRHKCDNPRCVNPEHLETGTQADNMQDMVDRDRSLKGEKHRAAKLSSEQVLSIRAEYVPRSRTHGTRALGRKYGVHPTMISLIVNGKNWKEF